jgi:23S rRNA (cytosine1962-C5)-methyltransferase
MSMEPAAHRPPRVTALEYTPLAVLGTAGFEDYALLDSGAGRKLERFGRYVFDRPEPQALWQPRLEVARWLRADAVFKSDEEEGESGRWRWSKPLPEAWPIAVMGVTALCRLTSFHHLGIFPEQLPHWQWMAERIAAVGHERPRVLNLFAYTGVASLIAARLGAEVTHVDASKKAIAWAKANQNASRLDPASVRWILDDARKFTAREVRRGRTYHVILVDPPKFGRGPLGEVWDLFTDLPPLLRDCSKLLAPDAASLVLTCYAIRASALSFGTLLREALADRAGRHETGELAIREANGGRLLSSSLFSRWSSGK